MTGWFNIVGLIGIVASVAYGCAFFLTQLFGLYGLESWGVNFGDKQHILPETFLLFVIILVLYTLVNIFADRFLALFNSISVGWHVLGARSSSGSSSSSPTITRAPTSSSPTGSTTPGFAGGLDERPAPSGSWCCPSASC